MPIPLPIIIAVIAAAGGLAGGALSRQPEVNRLKEQVKKLQQEIERLQKIIIEQDRQINELKIRYNALKAYSFIERIKQKSKLKGAIMFQYCFKEYIELLVAKSQNLTFQLNQQEQLFFNIFETLINNVEISIEEKMYLREYIREKYSSQIESMILIETDNLIKKVENVNVA